MVNRHDGRLAVTGGQIDGDDPPVLVVVGTQHRGDTGAVGVPDDALDRERPGRSVAGLVRGFIVCMVGRHAVGCCAFGRRGGGVFFGVALFVARLALVLEPRQRVVRDHRQRRGVERVLFLADQIQQHQRIIPALLLANVRPDGARRHIPVLVDIFRDDVAFRRPRVVRHAQQHPPARGRQRPPADRLSLAQIEGPWHARGVGVSPRLVAVLAFLLARLAPTDDLEQPVLLPGEVGLVLLVFCIVVRLVVEADVRRLPLHARGVDDEPHPAPAEGDRAVGHEHRAPLAGGGPCLLRQLARFEIADEDIPGTRKGFSGPVGVVRTPSGRDEGALFVRDPCGLAAGGVDLPEVAQRRSFVFAVVQHGGSVPRPVRPLGRPRDPFRVVHDLFESLALRGRGRQQPEHGEEPAEVVSHGASIR